VEHLITGGEEVKIIFPIFFIFDEDSTMQQDYYLGIMSGTSLDGGFDHQPDVWGSAFVGRQRVAAVGGRGRHLCAEYRDEPSAGVYRRDLGASFDAYREKQHRLLCAVR